MILARSICRASSDRGHKAAIIDADEQATSFKWSRRRKESAPTVEQLDGRTLAEAVAGLKERGTRLSGASTLPPMTNPSSTSPPT